MTFGVHLGIDFHEILDFVIICENHPNAYIQSIWVGSAHSKPHIFRPKFNQKIQIRLRACRRPSILSPVESAPPPNFRDALFSLLQGADPLDPKAPQGPHPTPTPQGTQGDPKGQGKGAKGPREPKGDQRGSSRSREISENCFCPNHNEMASKTLNFNRF